MAYTLRPEARVARGATYLFVQGIASSIIGVVYFVILARSFPPPRPDMGVYAILTFIFTLVQVFGTFALPSAAVRYIAKYLAEGHSERAKSVVTRVLQVSLLTSIILSLFLLVSAEWLSMLLLGTSIWAPLFQALAFASFFTIFNAQIGSFLQGLQKMREMAIVSLVYAMVEKSFAILLLYLGWGLISVIYGWLTGLIVSSLLGLILTAKSLGIAGKPHSMRTLINFSCPLYLSGILGFAADWVDRLFILPYMGAVYLGMYNIALRAAIVPGLISSSIVTALFPQLSELYAQRGADTLKRAFHVSTRYAVLVGFPMIVGLAALAYPILVLFAGVEYAEAALPLTILCLAALPGALGIAISPTMLTLERTKTASVITIASIIFNTLICYITLAYLNLGMLGAAWARVFASIIGFGLGAYALRFLKVDFDKEALCKASIASIIMTVAIVLFDVLRQVLTPPPHQFFVFRLRFLPLYVIVGAAVYFLSLVALRAIKKYDVELIHDYLPKRLRWIAAWLGRIAFIE